MQKDELKQNVKSYAQKFEDGGLRLLKKGQKGVIHAIFSRFGLVLLLLVLWPVEGKQYEVGQKVNVVIDTAQTWLVKGKALD